MTATLSLLPIQFRAPTPVRDFLRGLRRWLTYRPERRYLGGRGGPPRG